MNSGVLIYMLIQSVFIVIALVAIETLVILLSNYERTKHWFNFLPPVFFIYFLPMVASTLGLIDPKSPVLGWITAHILPMALFLLLVTVDVKAILRLGGKALGMFFIGSAGIIAGAVLSFSIFRNFVGNEFWAGFGALSASWTGGSANMIAVKEALSVPDAVFLPMVVVDTVVPYVWMGILIAAVKWEGRFDHWNRADRAVLEQLSVSVEKREAERAKREGPAQKRVWWKFIGIRVLIIHAAVLAGVFSHTIAEKLPVIPNVISSTAWMIIIVTALALLLSFTPMRKCEHHGAPGMGQRWLYFVLTAIGAKASLAHLGASVVLIGAGFVIVAVHIVVLLIGARFLRAPLFLVATASQANIGGVASAPAVAAIYEPGLASVGLLLAIMGNIVGTYLGILCGQLCRGMI